MSEDSGFINKNKPQMKAPRVTPLEGVSTYAPQGIRVRGVENPQGFGIDERRCGLDFCGSLGKGMLAAEALRDAPGLTPLSFGVDIHESIRYRMSVEGEFSATEGTENTETMRNSAGLTPLHIKKEPQINADERRCCCIGIGKKLIDSEKQRHSSGLSAPLSLGGEFHKRGVI